MKRLLQTSLFLCVSIAANAYGAHNPNNCPILTQTYICPTGDEVSFSSTKVENGVEYKIMKKEEQTVWADGAIVNGGSELLEMGILGSRSSCNKKDSFTYEEFVHDDGLPAEATSTYKFIGEYLFMEHIFDFRNAVMTHAPERSKCVKVESAHLIDINPITTGAACNKAVTSMHIKLSGLKLLLAKTYENENQQYDHEYKIETKSQEIYDYLDTCSEQCSDFVYSRIECIKTVTESLDLRSEYRENQI